MKKATNTERNRLFLACVVTAVGTALFFRAKVQEVAGEAWDNGYWTGRDAEREDWNYPTGTHRA